MKKKRTEDRNKKDIGMENWGGIKREQTFDQVYIISVLLNRVKNYRGAKITTKIKLMI